MALPSWTKISGSELASIQERTDISIALPLEETSGITVTVISGALPTGLRINDYRIKGVAVEVSKTTEFEFVLRASNAEGIADRTYKIVVEGADAPVWQTSIRWAPRCAEYLGLAAIASLFATAPRMNRAFRPVNGVCAGFMPNMMTHSMHVSQC